MSLSESQKKQYMLDSNCPYCEHDEIQMFGPSRQGVVDGEARALCRCLCCSNMWVERYALVDVQDLEEEGT